MNHTQGILKPDIMLKSPSGTGARTFSEWVANHVSLEQVLGLAGFLAPDFFEVGEYLFWDRYVAANVEQMAPIQTPFGDDPTTVERYFNTINLGEFFLASSDTAVHQADLLRAFGIVLEHFWRQALERRFPDQQFQFEIAEDLFREEGLCMTFWRLRLPVSDTAS